MSKYEKVLFVWLTFSAILMAFEGAVGGLCGYFIINYWFLSFLERGGD